MAKAKLIQKGNNIDYVAASSIEYLDVIPMITRIGIALENIESGETGSVAAAEVWEMPAAAAEAFDVGDQLYWDSAADNLTKIATGNIPAGWATEAKAASEIVARVKIG